MGKLFRVCVVLALSMALASACAAKKAGKTAAKAEPKSSSYVAREYRFPQQYVEVNGLKLSYIEAGSGDKTILFVHGVGGSLNNWDYNFEFFASRYHTVALDLPGHGNSDKPDVNYSVKLHAEYIYGFMQAKGIQKAVIIGHSMGGQAAVLLQLAHPEAVEALVLVAPSGGDMYVTSGLNWIGSRQYVRRSVTTMSRIAGAPYKGFERVVWEYLQRDGKKGYVSSLVYDANSYPTKEYLQGEIKYYYSFMNSPEFPKFVKAIRKSGASIPADFIRDDLHKVTAPTLVVWGRFDGIIPFEGALIFNDLIPTSMMAIFPETGHMPMIEKPDRFNRVVLEFLQ